MGTNDIFRPGVMKTIEETLTALSTELRELSLKIHGEHSLAILFPLPSGLRRRTDHPELGFQEKSVVRIRPLFLLFLNMNRL